MKKIYTFRGEKGEKKPSEPKNGLAPKILVGFFFKGPPKKIKNCCKNEIA
jgi:hypothetical protein